MPAPKRALTAAASAALLLGLLPATAVAAASSPAPAPVGSTAGAAAGGTADLQRVRTRVSLTGTHTWYRQLYRGLPVVDGFLVRHTPRNGKAATVVDGRRPVPAGLDVRPAVTAGRARTAGLAAAARLAAQDGARRGAPGKRPLPGGPAPRVSGDARLSVVGGAHPRLVWQVVTRTAGGGSIRTLVDARTGSTVAVTRLSDGFRGAGRVFDPNPVAALRDQRLTDRGNKDYPRLAGAYRTVALDDLTDRRLLIGRWAQDTNDDAVSSTRHRFLFHRDRPGFEQVSAYYGITAAQRYLRSIGFTDANAEPQRFAADAFADDNSYYDPETDTISFGTGGVDDAEDLEVVWHEYGHAVQDDQSPGFGATEEAGAIGEGFGDYLAVTLSVPRGKGYDRPCVADWDATSYTDAPHCLRRTDTAKTVADRTGEVHDDGEIWSAALWEVNRTLGRVQADRVIVESQFYYRPDTTFAQAAQNVVGAARALNGKAAADRVARIFAKRGLLGKA
ncbi:M36 family metallopeptidase [Streptomyces sp. NPDC001380]|uniref:M36 family metallopeptidase n=1 Tax=Streptomyces sp. NPDC001380 TaxID=3364566 RepID=UPI0036978295